MTIESFEARPGTFSRIRVVKGTKVSGHRLEPDQVIAVVDNETSPGEDELRRRDADVLVRCRQAVALLEDAGDDGRGGNEPEPEPEPGGDDD